MTRPSSQELLRVAVAINAKLEERASSLPEFDLPEDMWLRCQRLTQQLQHARSHGWRTAYLRRRKELLPALEHLRLIIADRERRLRLPFTPTASLREILLDLKALHEEFGLVEWDLREGTLSVTTEPIALETIELGSFSIVLRWRSTDRALNYRVVATDPQSPSRDDSVTHPHVQHESLCEGEGKPAIEAAMAGGRVFDFFCLVRGILQNYNPSSAYVDLHDWHGSVCSDCDGTYCNDETGSCDRCEATLCNDCQTLCGGCDEPYCSDCTDRCDACHESSCMSCLDRCRQCERCICRNCQSETNLCERCHDQEHETPSEAVAAAE